MGVFCAAFKGLIWIFALPTPGQDNPHEEIFLEDRFPSAHTCAGCHPDHFREWSVSSHSYALFSPVFNAMQAKILDLTNGTNGDFCIRCHTPVGMNIGEAEVMSPMDRHATSREGVTCITCHRVNRAYGKISGRLSIREGDIFEPVYGPRGNQELKRVIESGDYKVNAERGELGRAIHADVEQFFELTKPGFCGTCHDVNLVNGFRLEEAFSEYKTSPAAKAGTTCQDCHMGKTPGVADGYREGPAAIVGGKPTKARKRTDHMFIGPDYSVVHPGIFPHNPRAAKMATLREWLTFDWESGWGTDEFEDLDPEEDRFPPRWKSIDDRYDAREILEDNLALLQRASEDRLALLRAGYRLSDVDVTKANLQRGMEFKVSVSNGTNGHGVPTGFDAERVVFLRVRVSDPDGREIFSSGDLDRNGDLRDSHSHDVLNDHVPLDRQLFSLQSKFVVRMLRGGEREQVLAVNTSQSARPFLRPSTSSTILTGRPAGARKHKMNIEPDGTRTARYRVQSRAMTVPGKYRVRVALVAGMVPVNLVREIQSVGFDYGLTVDQIADRVVAGHQVIWQREADVEVGGRP